MHLDEVGINFLVKEEGGYILHPYKDSKGIPTIGVGNTYYEDGTKVSMNDSIITKDRAESLFKIIVHNFELMVYSHLAKTITQNQFNALVSLAYNIGDAFKQSTVLKLVNKDPNDLNITEAFEAWCRAGTNKTALLSRRKREAQLYFTK